ncbi:hypothetical protein V8C35DRAFT_315431 [Trichoderma chlorosporum]
MTWLFAYLIAFATAFATLGSCFQQSQISLPTIKAQWDSDTRYAYDVAQSPLCDDGEKQKFRAKFGAGAGVSVLGWPSKGGLYVLEQCFTVELEFLKLDRFHDTPRPSISEPGAAEEEEEHCNRMRQLGAIWWQSEREWHMSLIRETIGVGVNDAFIKVGWPAGGGVWVLNVTYYEAMNKGAGVIYNAPDMEHRCQLIEQLGGVFYENPKDWLDLDLE